MSATYNFTGKKVLVTGASQGIGFDLCKDLAGCGAEVYALARNEEALKKLTDEVEGVTAVTCDVTASAETIEKALLQHQPFDYLVNNAGIAILESVLESKAENIDKTLAVNLRAPIMITQIVSKQMIEHKIKGVIVNVSSVASLRPLQDHTSYCASKAGLDMATRCMAKELGPHGIRVNAVNPTVVFTTMGRQNWSDPAKAGPLLEQIPVGRFAETSDVINSIKFLLSDDSAMTTGSIVTVDGGYGNQ